MTVASSRNTEQRTEEHFAASVAETYRRGDRLFGRLLIVQWAVSLLVALIRSPYTWNGAESVIHPHVHFAALGGALVTLPPIVLASYSPGTALTRHAMAFAQMSWSALIIHITGGRIESHFHVFGSLAFLAFYRDSRVLGTATLVVAADHLLRGYFAPESLYGVPYPERWRFLEHAAWMLFENTVLVLGISESLREMRTLSSRQAELEVTTESIESKVAERTQDLEHSREQYRQIVESTHAIPFELNADAGYFAYLGSRAFDRLGFSEDACTMPGYLDALLPHDRFQSFRDSLERDECGDIDLECTLPGPGGREVSVRWVASSERSFGQLWVRGLMLDITDQRRLERELMQAQKLESVGRLAAGVAHEINTPVQFVSDSVYFIRDAMTDIAHVFESYRGLRRTVLNGGNAAAAAEDTVDAEETSDIDYIMENAPKALDRALDGLNRVATIVRSMKEFAHPDRRQMSPTDVNRAVQSTLTIAANECKYVADVVTDFEELPLVSCFAGELNQVVLNLVVNASHAIAERVGKSGTKGTITVRTRTIGNDVEIQVGDTGAGIPLSVRPHIFDPFFTTKEVGRGTGQGLAIAHNVVVDKHGGSLRFETELEVGTTFFIRIPIAPASTAVEISDATA